MVDLSRSMFPPTASSMPVISKVSLPSLRIKGFYLAVATLAAQFFFEWLFGRVGWFYNYNDSGAIEVPVRKVFDIVVTGPTATTQVRYIVVLSIVVILSFIAVNILRGRIGRSWMSIRDMDIAAELIGIKPLNTKLLAFAISSFYAGIAGSLFIFTYFLVFLIKQLSYF